MGRTRKRFNWKARQQVKTEVDNSETKKIKLDISTLSQSNEAADCSDSNALALPSQKRKTQRKNNVREMPQKRLSKKEKRKLECVLKRSEKRKKRSALLEALAQVQAQPREMVHYLSTADMQTKRKKLIKHGDIGGAGGNGEVERKVTSIKGALKRKRQQEEEEEEEEDTSSEEGVEDNSEGEKDDEVKGDCIAEDNYVNTAQVPDEETVLPASKVQDSPDKSETTTPTPSSSSSSSKFNLQLLISHNIDCRDALVKQWSSQPTFLLKSYLQWLPEPEHHIVTQIWPPI